MFLLPGDKFMPEWHLRQSRCACKLFWTVYKNLKEPVILVTFTEIN